MGYGGVRFIITEFCRSRSSKFTELGLQVTINKIQRKLSKIIVNFFVFCSVLEKEKKYREWQKLTV